MSNKKALLISFYFPPFFNPCSVRMGKFAKYLADYGWESIVLTVERKEDPSKYMQLEIDESHIYRTPYFVLGDYFSTKLINNPVVDYDKKPKPIIKNKCRDKTFIIGLLRTLRPIYNAPFLNKIFWDPIGWYPHAMKKGMEILTKEKIDIIFSTYNPSLPHLIAARLHKQTGIPWVADYRDLWSHNPYYAKTQPFQFIEEYWEKRIMRNCNLLTSVSEPLVKDLEAFHKIKAITIYNGFDYDDFKIKVPLTSKFTITYTGEIYTPRLDPTPFFEALSELKREGIISSIDFEVRFFGTFTVNNPNVLSKKFGLQDIVKTFGFIPLEQSINKQKESTALLLLGWNDPKAGDLTSKVFEYLGAGRPVLAITYKNGPLGRLITDSGSGVVVNTAVEVKEILVKWVNDFRVNGNILSYFQPNPKIIQNYTRKEATRKLADIFDKVISATM